jgi:hypothetical protein
MAKLLAQNHNFGLAHGLPKNHDGCAGDANGPCEVKDLSMPYRCPRHDVLLLCSRCLLVALQGDPRQAELMDRRGLTSTHLARARTEIPLCDVWARAAMYRMCR